MGGGVGGGGGGDGRGIADEMLESPAHTREERRLKVLQSCEEVRETMQLREEDVRESESLESETLFRTPLDHPPDDGQEQLLTEGLRVCLLFLRR